MKSPCALICKSRLSFAFSLAACIGMAAVTSAAPIEVAKQKESDWVDARWSQTDLGNFHSSLVALKGGTVAKGLSIRVGTEGEATVTYDTATATLRAGWRGGFLKFDATRYGLLHNPAPASEPAFILPKASTNTAVRWRGLHVHGPRVLLEYQVADTTVLEAPGVEKNGEIAAFTRTLEADKGGEVRLRVFEGKQGSITITNAQGVLIASVASGPVFALREGDLQVAGGALELVLPSRDSTRRARLFIVPGEPSADAVANLVRAAKTAEPLQALAKPGPARWQPLTTRGQRGFGNDAFVIDTLTVPYQNPWKALFFTSGVDFLPNGDAAVCTIHGDVWLVSGIDDKLERLTWRRFATGLFQPLGLRVREGKVHVLGRDQITVLHDQNGDGEADYYENFYNGIHTSTGGHDYVTSLETDTNGNFYYVDPRGAHRVAADGSRAETIAAGWRNPNGMGVSPDGKIVTVAPQQGEWTPSSCISEARPAGWYGFAGPRITQERPLGYDPQLCWIPHNVDNSGGSQLWVTSDRWSPLKGQLLHFSYGRCAQMLVLREVVDGVAQGAVAPIPGRFLSGIMRGAFNPRDGQLYVVGSTGWQTSAARDGCLQRVRFTGADPMLPVESHVHANGIRLTFASELNQASAEDPGSYSFSHWNYRYGQQYGSKDYSPSDPKKEGRDTLTVKSARLLPDKKTVFIEVTDLRPVMQYELKYSLNAVRGKPMRSFICGTINRLGEPFTPQ